MKGIIIVDHGSKRDESNRAFLTIVQKFSERSKSFIVEPAHMELAPPTLEEAFDRAVARGAEEIVIHPFFLLPGNHLTKDIPALCKAAGKKHPHIPWKITQSLGESDLILDIIADRIKSCV